MNDIGLHVQAGYQKMFTSTYNL